MPELVEKGYIVEPLDYFFTPMNAYQCIPDWKGIYESIVDCANNPLSVPEMIDLQNTIHQKYSWDIIVQNYWKPFLENLPINQSPKIEKRQSKVTTK